jgi:hypothetical protein
MTKNIIFTHLIFVLFVNYVLSFNSNTPTWLTSPYFKAGYNQVISSAQGNTSSPTYTFIFSSIFPSIPKLAYGIKCYRGNFINYFRYGHINKLNVRNSKSQFNELNIHSIDDNNRTNNYIFTDSPIHRNRPCVSSSFEQF